MGQKLPKQKDSFWAREDFVWECIYFFIAPGQRLTRKSTTKLVRAIGQASVLVLLPWTVFAMAAVMCVGSVVIFVDAAVNWYRDV